MNSFGTLLFSAMSLLPVMHRMNNLNLMFVWPCISDTVV